uniref:Uncharacterized protein n=1 Tax=Cacopsylla melanoneura TaxID=428564 RepID=A0A8D8M0C2_9HEMI
MSYVLFYFKLDVISIFIIILPTIIITYYLIIISLIIIIIIIMCSNFTRIKYLPCSLDPRILNYLSNNLTTELPRQIIYCRYTQLLTLESRYSRLFLISEV